MSLKKLLAVVAAASLVTAVPALAANPFSDVPEGHWAYDAVAELAAKGAITGYPDDTFRGKKIMTRYEIAVMLARMLADAKEYDCSSLRALMVEFTPELEAMGVKVDGFDGRINALEKGMGGWAIGVEMRFDYQDWEDDVDKAGFSMNRARIYLHRDLANGVSFNARWHNDQFDQFYMTAKDFLGVYGLSAKAGEFPVDWEALDGLYTYGNDGGDATMLDVMVRGFELTYDYGPLSVTGFAASNMSNTYETIDGFSSGVYNANLSDDYYGIRLKYEFCVRLWLSVNALFGSGDGSHDTTEYAEDVYWAAAGFKPFGGLEIKGAYYYEELENKYGLDDDDASAYKIILDLDQDLLRFTSLWLEYQHFDEGFSIFNDSHSFQTKLANKYLGSDPMGGFFTFTADHDIFYAHARQRWTYKLSSFEEFEYADADGAGDMTNVVIGFNYVYSPSLSFQLSYGWQDGDCIKGSGYENNMLRFRTYLFVGSCYDTGLDIGGGW